MQAQKEEETTRALIIQPVYEQTDRPQRQKKKGAVFLILLMLACKRNTPKTGSYVD